VENRRLLSIALAIALPLAPIGCSTPATAKPGDPFSALTQPKPEPTFAEKFSNSFKANTAKAGGMFAGKKSDSELDPISLSHKTAKPGLDLYISMAEAAERVGNVEEADRQFQAALKQAPNDLNVLLAYAHSLDRRGDFVKATSHYKKAIEKHPQEAGPRNDLGLCYHRRGMLREAADSLIRAVELQPDRKLYRNNLAAVMVDMGNIDEAYGQLQAAHGDAIAHYNIGYMLAKKGQNSAALTHFHKAASVDPSLVAAREWIVRLSPSERGMPSETIAVRPERPEVGVPVQEVEAPVAVPPVSTSNDAEVPPSPGAILTTPTYQSAAAPAVTQQTLRQPESPRRTLRVTPVQFPYRASETSQVLSTDVPPVPSDVQIRTSTVDRSSSSSSGAPVTRLHVSTDSDTSGF